MKILLADHSCDTTNIGVDLAEILVRSGHVKSKTEARRQIEQRSIRIEAHTVVDKFARLVWGDSGFILVEKREAC